MSHHPEVEVLEILEHDPEVVKLLKEIVRSICRIEQEILRPPFTPATSVQITQIGNIMLTISPGNAPTFGAAVQPVNAGPFVASNVLWSVSGDPGATVAQITSDATGLSATLTLSTSVVLGAILALAVVVTNQDGTTVTNTDSLTVVPQGNPPPPFVPATGVAIQQLT